MLRIGIGNRNKSMGWFKLGGGKKTAEEPLPAGQQAGADPARASDGPEADDGTEEVQVQRKPPDALADLFLVMEEHLNELELEDIGEIVDELQQPPPLVDRLTSGLNDPEDLREAILSSPSLSADVLRVVNSAAFVLSSPISSIEHAVTYLGTTMVKGLVLQSAVTQVMEFQNDVQKAAYMRIWRSSYIASAAAEAYARLLDLDEPSLYATRALLLNIGDLALISSRPELAAIYAPKSTLLSRVETQQREILANTAVISAILAKRWGLPADLYDALRHSLTPLTWAPADNQRDEEAQRDDVILYLAARIGDAVAYGGVSDLADLDLPVGETEDLFFLGEYLRRLDLRELLSAFEDRKYGARVQRIITTFGT
jgi:HD-like signal output (HDOD) protein